MKFNFRNENIRNLLSGENYIYLVGTLLVIAALVRVAALIDYDKLRIRNPCFYLSYKSVAYEVYVFAEKIFYPA